MGIITITRWLISYFQYVQYIVSLISPNKLKINKNLTKSHLCDQNIKIIMKTGGSYFNCHFEYYLIQDKERYRIRHNFNSFLSKKTDKIFKEMTRFTLDRKLDCFVQSCKFLMFTNSLRSG